MVKFILSNYVEEAMTQAVYDKLEDGMFTGRIPPCRGVIAFASTLQECVVELRSTLEDWILVGLKLKHPLPTNAEYSTPQLRMMLNEVETIIDRKITVDEWNNL